MGFIIEEEHTFSPYGITIAGVYVTIKGKYQHSKSRIGIDGDIFTKYHVTADYYVYAENNPDLEPIQTDSVTITEDLPVENCIAKIYTKIKLDFPGKTFTDDL